MADKNAKKEAVKKLGLDAATVPWYKRVLYWGAGLAVVGAVGYFGWQATQKTEVVTFVTEDARVGDISVTVTADGTLKPLRTVSLGSELSGIVRKVNVDVNDVIRNGQTLIELDRANLLARVASGEAGLQSAKASLAQAEAQLNEAQVRYDRQLELHRLSGGRMPAKTDLETQKATVLTAKATVEVARASIADAEATLSTAKTDLSKAEIKSPIDGVVLARTVEPGYAVAASLQAVELLTLATDLRTLELQVDVDEADIGVVAARQDAYFTVSAYPNRRFAATLKKVAFGATTTENVVTYTTYLNVDNSDLLLRPGMTASATILTAQKDDVLLVPNSALRFKPRTTEKKSGSAVMMGPPHRMGSSKVVRDEVQHGERERTIYVLRDGKPVEAKVVTGLTDGTRTEIVSGDIREGDKIVVDQRRSGEA